MHYYKRNLGDYAKKAGRLSMLQHGSYTLLIDACYDREQFPTMDEAIEWTWASTTEEVEAVTFVLRKFFTLEDGVYVQKRIQEEIAEYHGKAETNKRIAQEREAKRKENATNRARVVDEAPPNHKPLTKNQEPVTKSEGTARASRLPADLSMPDSWLTFCQTERPDLNPDATFARFRDYWIAKPGKQGTKLDWLATWRNWVRDQRVQRDTASQPVETFRERDARLGREKWERMTGRIHPDSIRAQASTVLDVITSNTLEIEHAQGH